MHCLTKEEQDEYDSLSDHEKQQLNFPKTIKPIAWCNYLGRRLTKNEHHILDNFRGEASTNTIMKKLYNKCLARGLYVPMLSQADGNCMFESLNYHKIGSDVDSLRSGLAVLIYLFKDKEKFMPNMDLTLKQMFDAFNEIEFVAKYVKVKDDSGEEVLEKKFYKYTFDIMCQDLTNNGSWSKLPTEIILRVISYIYKVEIEIINSCNDYAHIINSYENVDPPVKLRKIYLGHLGESHYLPVDILEEGVTPTNMYYTNARKKFLKWAGKQEVFTQKRYLAMLRSQNIAIPEDSMWNKVCSDDIQTERVCENYNTQNESVDSTQNQSIPENNYNQIHKPQNEFVDITSEIDNTGAQPQNMLKFDKS